MLPWRQNLTPTVLLFWKFLTSQDLLMFNSVKVCEIQIFSCSISSLSFSGSVLSKIYAKYWPSDFCDNKLSVSFIPKEEK